MTIFTEGVAGKAGGEFCCVVKIDDSMWRQCTRHLSLGGAERTLKSITFDVSGICFPVLVRDIEKFPGSFFDTAMREESHAAGIPVIIQRNAEIFSYVHAFLVSGALPREDGKLNLSVEVVNALKDEADFFKLSALKAECAVLERKEGLEDQLDSYRTIRNYVVGVHERLDKKEGIVCEYPTEAHSATDLVVVLSNITNPFCVKETFKPGRHADMALFKSSTISSLNIPELLAQCKRSAFGKGTKTVLDTAVRKSWEIPAKELDKATLDWLAIYFQYDTPLQEEMAPNMQLELRPYKLVIYQEGGHFDAHRDTVRGDGHIGTLVLILNSDHTGGELEITHNGQTEVVTGPYSWVAMYGDCLHKINPVTSGVRVSLIFDIYAGRVRVDEYEFWSRNRVMPAQEGILGIGRGNRSAILDGVEKELSEYDTLVICLAHKYPLHQTTPTYLKGGDRALYELLQDMYEVQVVACALDAAFSYDNYITSEVSGCLFTSFPPDAPQRFIAPPTNRRTKFLIPTLNFESVLDYTPFYELVGNEAQDVAAVYLVSGLQLRKRV